MHAQVREARRRGLHVVHVSWLYHCAAHFTRAPEHRFPLLSHHQFHMDEHQIRCLPPDEVEAVSESGLMNRVVQRWHMQVCVFCG
jgi:hypothetical protein